MVLNVVIFGPPASGKGSVSEALIEKYNLTHISTGDLLRAKTAEDSDEARELAETMKSGALVADSVVIKLVKDVVEKDENAKTNGYLLDGFPRSVEQAETMFGKNAPADLKLATPNVVVVLDVTFDTLKERIVNRRIDPETKRIYNIVKDEIPEDVAARLIQRADDTEEALKNRVGTYEASTKAILDVLASNPETAIIRVDATQPLDDVRSEVGSKVDAVKAGAKIQPGVVADAPKKGNCCIIM